MLPIDQKRSGWPAAGLREDWPMHLIGSRRAHHKAIGTAYHTTGSQSILHPINSVPDLVCICILHPVNPVKLTNC